MRFVGSGTTSTLALSVTLALAAVSLPARADDLARAPSFPGCPVVRDYDAPDPHRSTVNYLRAGAMAAFVSYLTWQYDFVLNKEAIYSVTGPELWHNLGRPPAWDTDSLSANFLGHPYAGAAYYNAARSSGLSFWESVPYTIAGSFFWEYLSESQRPATNDLITTPLGGIALGEIFYRLSSRALDNSATGFARFSREALATVINPVRGLNRLLGGDMWVDSEPPLAKPARILFQGGVDHVAAGSVTEPGRHGPSVLLSLDMEYGDLLPAPGRVTIPTYDFFDFRAAGYIRSGVAIQLQTLALLHGWSTELAAGDRTHRDNNVVGVVQSFDYQAGNAITYGGLGVGFGDLLVLRNGPRRRLRLDVDLEWAPLVAITGSVNPFVGTDTPRQYNLSTGPSGGVGVRWDVGRVGQLGLWAREYATTVIDGTPGHELLGYARAWYDVDAVRDVLGVGVATNLVHRWGNYSGGRSDFATQLSIQLYGTVHL